MPSFSILIADDEAPARGELSYILGQLAPEAELHTARNGQAALDSLSEHEIDVVFLDINMPGLDGLTTASLLLELPNPPLIVFATAYNEHALRAFELAAIDYVVKPFDEKRLAQTVARLRQRLAAQDSRSAQEALRDYLATAVASPPPLTKLWAEKANGNRLLVDYAQICAFEAEGKKVSLTTFAGEKYGVRQTLKELEEHLTPHAFARVHKGFIVNLDAIAEVAPWFSGGFVLKLNDAAGSEIPLSRRYAAKLKALIGW